MKAHQILTDQCMHAFYFKWLIHVLQVSVQIFTHVTRDILIEYSHANESLFVMMNSCIWQHVHVGYSAVDMHAPSHSSSSLLKLIISLSHDYSKLK